MNRIKRLPVVVATLIGAACANASIITLGATLDNTLYESASGDKSNGLGPTMYTGVTNNSLIRRSLIKFDIAGNLPSGATVNSVSLKLHLSRAAVITGSDVTIHDVLQSWGEGTSNAGSAGGGNGAASTTGDATWIHRFFNTSSWTNAGGDFTATALATTSVADLGFYSWSSAGLTGSVQAMLNNPGSNNGWLLRHVDEATALTAKQFDTRESSTANFRPELTIDYTPVPEPATMLALAGGLALMARKRKAS